MSGLATRPEIIPQSENTLFTTEGDLTFQGRLGRANLIVTDRHTYRIENTPLGDEAILTLDNEEIRNPRLEDLVDASALLVDYRGKPVELLRSTSKRALVLAGAEKQLKALVEGKQIPELESAVRVCPKCGRPLPKDSEVCENCINRGQTLARLFSYAGPYKVRLLWGTLLILGGTSADLLPPLLTRHLVDDVLTKGHISLFVWLILGLIASRVLSSSLQIARGRNVAFLGMKMAVAIRTSLFDKLQTLSLSFYDRRNVGSIMSRMTNDTSALYDVLVDGIPVVLNQAAMLIGIPVAMFLMNWRIALYVIAPVPVVLFAVRLFRRRMMRVWSRYWHAWSRLGGTLNGVLQGTRVIKAFRGENREMNRFGRRVSGLAELGYEAESNWATFFPLVTLIMAASTIMVWWIGGLGVLRGTMTIGELTAFIGYVVMLQQPMMMLQRIVDWTTRSLTAAERVFEVMDTPVDIQEKADPVHFDKIDGHIVFSDVHFGYDKAREVLHGIDLEVKPGEMIGIVGHSGSGKTTLINILLRFYDPTQGSIKLDGVDLRDLSLDDFRRNVGVVLQESFLFPGSIRDNIAYGRPDCSLEEIIGAAKAANAHDFIIHFPDGYDSYVGERGQRLSGGERQRIAIARAILHNPKLLVLDEATSSVDTETERMIQEALENLVEGRTVIAIAHRLSTLRAADRLIVLEEGRIAEVGTHDELLAKEDGLYAKLVKMQTELNRVQQNYIFEGEGGEEEAAS